MHLIIITGMSGSGKSIALRQLEDDGYYCIDNLPISFALPLIRDLQSRNLEYLALAIDARSFALAQANVTDTLQALAEIDIHPQILFLTATTPELIQRFSETRRRHPLTSAQNNVSLQEAVEIERELLGPVLPYAHVLDTTDVQPGVLRQWIQAFSQAPSSGMTLAFESFAFKHGLPIRADLVYDVRCLANPYYDKALRPHTGLDQPIIDFFADTPDRTRMIDDIANFILRWLSHYEAQNRHYLSVAVGCTGGQHRSVYVAQALYERFHRLGHACLVRHRNLDNRRLMITQTL